MRALLARLRGEEGGFTLVELLVAMFVMVLVLGAIYSLFSSTSKTLVTGGIEEENAQNARAVLENMDREIRYAYPQSPSNPRLLLLAREDVIRFGNDTNSTPGVQPGEIVAYYEHDGALYRDTGTGAGSEAGTTEAVSSTAERLLEVDSVRFEYWGSSGTTAALERILEPTINEAQVQTVRTRIVMGGQDGSTETVLDNEIDLSNRRQ